MVGGCNLQFWSLAAPAYSAVMSMLELSWCVQLLFTTKSTTDKSYWYPWTFVEKLPDSEAVLRFTLLCFVLHILWLLSSLILIFQMKIPKHWTTLFWLSSTFLVTLWSVATSIYFLVRLNDLPPNLSEARRKTLHNSYLVLLLIFSGGFLFLFTNIILLTYLGRKWMNSCIFCPQTDDSRGFYNPLSSRTVPVQNYGDNSPGIQMDDVIFDAREFRVNKIFHINDGNLSKLYSK